MRQLASRLALYAAIGIVIALLLIAALGWLSVALWLALQHVMSPAAAALWMGLATLFVALLMAVVVWASRRRRSRVGGGTQGAEDDLAARLAGLAGRDAVSFVSAHPGRAALVALAAGFVVGVSPQLRAALREMLK